MFTDEQYHLNTISIKDNGILLKRVHHINKQTQDPTKGKQDIVDTTVTCKMSYISKHKIKLCSLMLDEITINTNDDESHRISFGRDRYDFAEKLFYEVVHFIDFNGFKHS